MSIDGVLEALRTLETARDITPADKAKAVSELSKKSLAAKVSGERIKRALKDAGVSIKNESEAKGRNDGKPG